ncbi:MAG: GGDEF domain-containing protein [Deltaproteobacteria bacterium]|nr:GGDEF domain-containing protein [Deltaproteobacteria bacterium]
MNSRRIITCLMVPGSLVFLLSMAVWHWTAQPELLQTFLPFWPYVVLALGVLLGWRYQRSRLLLTLLVLTLSQPQLVEFLPLHMITFSLAVISIILPLNLLWLAFSSERHLLSLATTSRLIVIAGQGGLIWLAYHFYAQQSWAILRMNLFSHPLFDFMASLPLGTMLPLAIAMFVATFLSLLIALLWRPTMERGAQVWMLVSVFLAQLTTGDEALFYGATAVLILIVALLEASHSMAFRDELTGLGSRRALNEYLQRLSGCYTLAMVDIDHFKRVNDSHGHDIGDQVLKMVAGCLAKVKGGGKAFRYGGEEFTVVFSGKQRDHVLPYLEELRIDISRSVFSLRSKPRPKKKPKKIASKITKPKTLKVTVSMGVAEHIERKQKAAQVVKVADIALYRAKDGGRNKIC